MAETMTLYRIIVNPVPVLDDMRSQKALGIPLRRNDPYLIWLHDGISLVNSLEHAFRKARRRPWMGKAWVAELLIPAGVFQVEQTTDDLTHYTLWGDPHDILRYVVAIHSLPA